jgi:hypothetical protein
MPCDQRVEQEEQLMLSLRQTLQRRQQNRDVMFLLAAHGCCRVLARGRQIRAILRALDFCQPLRAAADRTNCLPKRRT